MLADLITVDVPDFENSGVAPHLIKLGVFVEDRAAVRTIAALHVNARRVRLLDKLAGVADRLESPEEEAGMVNLLETDEVRRISQDLSEHPPPSVLPVQAERGAAQKLVALNTQSCKQFV